MTRAKFFMSLLGIGAASKVDVIKPAEVGHFMPTGLIKGSDLLLQFRRTRNMGFRIYGKPNEPSPVDIDLLESENVSIAELKKIYGINSLN